MTFLERGASAIASMAAACAIGSLLFTGGMAYAWLTAHAFIPNELTVSAPGPALETPYAALYGNPEQSAYELVLDRGDSVPDEHEGRTLVATWRGMETGEADFAEAGSCPWRAHAPQIDTIASGEAAKAAPIHILDLTGWFKSMGALTCADVSGLTPDAQAQGARSAATNLSGLFNGCSALTSLNGISAWNVAGQVSAESMFAGCASLKSLDLSGWNMSSFAKTGSMFAGCSQLESVIFEDMGMGQCTDSSWMFANCPALTTIDGLDSFYCPNNGYLDSMFSGCASLTSVDLSGCGMPSLWSCSSMLKDCTSLEYLDISGFSIHSRGWEAAGLFPENSKLQRFITSNKVNTASAPTPSEQRSADGMTVCPGYWVSDDTGEAYSPKELANHLAQLGNSAEGYQRASFRRSAIEYGSEDAYAAIYRAQDGLQTLVFDKGASAPRTFEGADLALEVRDVLISGERAAEHWKLAPLTHVTIRSAMAPRSCCRWFTSQRNVRSFDGLDRLDMSTCKDVTQMFAYSGAEQLDVGTWRLPQDVIGADQMFMACESLKRLDLSSWTLDVSLSFASLYALSTFIVPECIDVHSLSGSGTGESPRFHDGLWYEDGTGPGLSPSEAANIIFYAKHQGGEPLMFTSEKADRSFAAIYSGGGSTLLFGRGIDVPQEVNGRTLVAEYRGLEEQDRPSLSWSSFSGDTCPWESYAASVDRVSAADGLGLAPIRPQGMSRWFLNMESLLQIEALEVGAIDPSAVQDASWLFCGCSRLGSIPSGFTSAFTARLTDCMAMFSRCASLQSLTVMPGHAMARVHDTYRMFDGCTNLASLDLSSWDISSLSTCSSMFRDCASLVSVTLPPAFVSPQRPNALQLAFSGCRSLQTLDATSWDLSSSYTLLQTFNACASLTSIQGAEAWDTSRVTTMNSTFRLCEALTLDCSAWSIASVTDSDAFSFGAPGVISPFEDAQALSEEEEPLETDEPDVVQDDAEDAFDSTMDAAPSEPEPDPEPEPEPTDPSEAPSEPDADPSETEPSPEDAAQTACVADAA